MPTRQAQRLAAALEQAGFTVWWDALIEGGTRFAESIDEALKRPMSWSSCGRSTRSSPTGSGRGGARRDRHRLVPLSLDGSPAAWFPPDPDDRSVPGWRGRADAPQIEADRSARLPPPWDSAPARTHIAAPVTARRALAVGGGAVAAAAGGGLVGLARRADRPARAPLAASPSCRSRTSAAIRRQAYLAGRTDRGIPVGLVAQFRADGARHDVLRTRCGTMAATPSSPGSSASAICSTARCSATATGSRRDQPHQWPNRFSEWSQRSNASSATFSRSRARSRARFERPVGAHGDRRAGAGRNSQCPGL